MPTKNRYVGRCVILLLCTLVSIDGCSRSSRQSQQPDTITIVCASSALPAISDVAESYELAVDRNRQSAVGIDVVSGPSNILAKQILAGAPADIFLSANKEWACNVEQADCVVDRVDLLANRLVLVVPNTNPRGIQTLAGLGAQEGGFSVAIGGQYVPLGIYTEQSLKKLNLLQTINEKSDMIRCANARATLALAERGEVDAAIVFESDAHSSSLVTVVEKVPAHLHEEIVYPLLLLKRPESEKGERKAARDFYEYLTTPEIRAVFEKHGFGL